MSNEVPATTQDIPKDTMKTTDVEAAERRILVDSSKPKFEINQSNVIPGMFLSNKGVEDTVGNEKPISTTKAFSGGSPEHHPTPITKRSLRDSGFQPEQTNIWSHDNGLKVQYDDVADKWRLLSSNLIVNFIEDIKA